MDPGIHLKLDNPYKKANIFSKLGFLWMLQLIYKATKHGIEIFDVYKTLDSDKSAKLGDELEVHWKKELERAKSKNSEPSLYRAISKMFLWYYMLLGFLLFIQYIFLRTFQPLVLAYLLKLFAPEAEPEENEARMYTTALVLVLFSGTTVFFNHHTFYAMCMVGMRARVAVCSLMYRKLLKLNKKSLGETSAGQVVNLLSNDVSRFDFVVLTLHFIWISPFQVILVTYFLWTVVGISALPGILALIMLTLPVQAGLGKYVQVLRRKIAKCTDSRVRLMNEIVSGINVIKMYAWEIPFQKLVAELRAREIKVLTTAAYVRGFFLSCMVFVERTTTYITVITYVLLSADNGNVITPDKLFSISQFFNALQLALAIFLPMAIQLLAESLVSVKRIKYLLLLDEIGEKQIEISKENKISLQHVNASWTNKSDHSTLNEITFEIPKGKLCAIVGPVGSGKSSILNLLLGELPIASGKVSVCGNISYASQEPWLFSSSVRNNIIFGRTFDKSLYKEVTRVCALLPDFSQLPNGDKTVVGERGSSLSGGQRARVNLARAIYRDADIYLMDDPLSAVDTHVGKHLFEECIMRYLAGKTRILVTHQLQYLKKADIIIVINEGRIEAMGSFNDLQSSEIDFAKMVVAADESGESVQGKDVKKARVERQESTATVTSLEEEDVQTKEEEVGLAGRSAIKEYVAAAGNWFTIFIVVVIIATGQLFSSSSDYFSSYWVAQETKKNSNLNRALDLTIPERMIGPITPQEELMYFSFSNTYRSRDANDEPAIETMTAIYIYTGLIIGLITFTLLRTVAFFKVTMVAAKKLHRSMFKALLQAPMRFFDSNPSGRILNRFSKDMGAIDEILPGKAMEALQVMLVMVGILVVICISNYYMVIVIVLFAILFLFLRKWYLDNVKKIKHIEGVAKSPVFSHMTASLDGLTTIRASGVESELVKQFDHHQNIHTSAFYLTVACSSSFGLWIDFLCVVFTAVVTFAMVALSGGSVDGATVGLAISQSLMLTGMVQYGMKQAGEVVAQVTSVERVLQYTQLDKEGPFDTPSDKPIEKEWPTSGNIVLCHMSLRYNPDDAPVLNDLNLTFLSGEKIGIVGRTGAGKSSLMAALFRLAPIEGVIEIDGVDTQTIGLSQLRRKISIIPQEPVLFSATLRYNLDPFGEYDDQKIWSALEEVELKESIGTLDFAVEEGGSNFSVGERQLVCLARAILRSNAILVLDEATANIDPKTDALIQNTIRKKFVSCTVLTIAHRLNTIMDSDKVLVLEKGRMVEFDHPHLLLQKKNGYFSGMVEQTGKGMSQTLHNVAKTSFLQKRASIQSIENSDLPVTQL